MKCIAYSYPVDQWRIISNEIKRRDHYTCQSCLKRFKMNELTIHHIFAREQGGDDVPDNLITLCNPCHNEIEEIGYMTKEDIYGFRSEEPEKIKAEKERQHLADLEEMIKRVDAYRPLWHAWVYGGGRSPLLDIRRSTG